MTGGRGAFGKNHTGIPSTVCLYSCTFYPMYGKTTSAGLSHGFILGHTGPNRAADQRRTSRHFRLPAAVVAAVLEQAAVASAGRVPRGRGLGVPPPGGIFLARPPREEAAAEAQLSLPHDEVRHDLQEEGDG